MYQLICHHTYKWAGIAVDLSPYGNDGEVTGAAALPHGASAGSGALRFDSPWSRLSIPHKATWDRLEALKIEATLRLDPGYPHRTLIVGHRSFAMMLGPSGFVWAGFVPPVSLPGSIVPPPSIPIVAPWEFVDNATSSPAPTGKWVTLEFEHNGFSRMSLHLDGKLIGSQPATSGVPPVGSLGVVIGNSNAEGGAGPLRGDLDQIRIWRRDPDAIRREFLGRPYTPEAARCWEKIGRAVIAAFDSDPECMRELLARWRLVFNHIMRALHELDAAAQNGLRALIDRYARLWFAGQIGSPAMANVLCELRLFMKRHAALDFAADPILNDRLLFSECAALLRKSVTLDCDPDIQAFLRLVQDSVDCEAPPKS